MDLALSSSMLMYSRAFLAVSLLAGISSMGCSGGGRVEVSGGGSSRPSQASAVTAASAFNAEEAVKLVAEAQTEPAQLEAVAKIEQSADADFDWASFWGQMRRGYLERFSPAARARLFDLHKHACFGKETHFQAFASLVRDSGNAIDYVAGSKRQCNAALGAALSADFIKKMYADLEAAPESEKPAAAASLSRFLSDEYRRASYLDWKTISATLTPSQWTRIARLLDRGGLGVALLELIETHQRMNENSSPAFVGTLSRALLTESGALEKAVSRLRYGAVLKILQSAPQLQYDQLSVEALTALLERLEKSYKPLLIEGAKEDRWTEALRQLGGLRAIEVRMNDRVPVETAVKWLEKIHRSAEAAFMADANAAQEFLSHREEDSLDIIWLRLRVAGRALDGRALLSNPRQASDLAALPRLERILGARLKIHFARKPAERVALLDQYCELLASEGLETRSVSLAEFETSFEKHWSEPGCLAVKTAAFPAERPLRIKLRHSSRPMAFDTVLRVPGVDLTLSGDALDASIIDLSAGPLQRHPDLPAEPTPESYNAIAFPILIGFEVTHDRNVPRGPGIHYVVFHFPYRTASKAPAPQAAPLEGYRGGNLKLELANADESFAPAFVSQGGPGQAAVPRKSGGAESKSMVDAADVRDWVARLNGVGVVGVSADTKHFFHTNPTAGMLHLLRDSAERERNKIKTFINESFFDLLDADQRRKAELACGGPVTRACLEEKLHDQIILEMHRELGKNSTPDEANTYIPRFDSEEYTEPKGEDVEQGQPGKTGQAGEIL